MMVISGVAGNGSLHMVKRLFNRDKPRGSQSPIRLTQRRGQGLWHRLVKDKRANAALIVAAGLIPLIAMMGAGVDMARGYIVKTRMQQACDVSAIAAQSGLVNGVLAADKLAYAQNIFNVNFAQGTLGADSFTPTIAVSPANMNAVIITASTNVPPTVMKIFGATSLPIKVVCEAAKKVGNIDVIHVISVARTTGNNFLDKTNILTSLKQGLKSFYDALGPGDSGGGRIRYGFVPYSMSVNVGFLLKPEYLRTSNNYQSRIWTGSSWNYAQKIVDVTTYLSGNTIANHAYMPSFPSDTFGIIAPATIKWAGCIEERDTNSSITPFSSLTIPSNAYDLNIDYIPNSNSTRWRPFMPETEYWALSAPINSSSYVLTGSPYGMRVINGSASFYAACPPRSRKLESYSSRTVAPNTSLTSYDDYVDSLVVDGDTYDDLGMIWGGRLISAGGIFSTENAAPTNGFPINRNIIITTQGNIFTQPDEYSAWGMNTFEGRIAPTSTTNIDLTARHKRRLAMVCNAIKAKGITIWVVKIAQSGYSELDNCATSTAHLYKATSAAELISQYKEIANKLRASN